MTSSAEGAPRKRDPVMVRCEPCRHEWVAAYLPMDVAAFARVLARAACPMCGETKRVVMAPGASRG